MIAQRRQSGPHGGYIRPRLLQGETQIIIFRAQQPDFIEHPRLAFLTGKHLKQKRRAQKDCSTGQYPRIGTQFGKQTGNDNGGRHQCIGDSDKRMSDGGHKNPKVYDGESLPRTP